ncbi:SusC/RagA family TonB-linked outer membrane protein [Saccharicrinis sp. GN24d3]|uniref:SusC/RagA family TonB-linked outer membrane protein n=1 Tax=Saccharicrinis sp. GN24d3 TaxID=3458416 RepID=UPI0040367E1D
MKNKSTTRYTLSRVVGIALIFVHFAAHSFGQSGTERTVSGNVTDAQTGEPIVGANIWIKETTKGTITDYDGNYTLVSEGIADVFVVSFVGYANQEVAVGDKMIINFKLSADSETLEDVVVVGYGSQKKESVIGSISSIKVANLKVPGANVSSSLAGQLSGIVAVNRSGEPGQGSEFYIRGISTFGANKTPLVLIDGIERDIDLVDPEDIASFSILKDATATAVYGVRGANGVVLITTRKGEEGKPKISVRSETGFVSPTQMPEMVNSHQFAELYNEASESEFYSPEVMEKYKDGSDPDLYPNVDWIKTLYKGVARNKRTNASVSGGGTIAKYFVSGSYYNEGSIFKSDGSNDYNSSINYSKYSFRANLDLALHETTTLSINLANVYESKDSPGESRDRIWQYTFRTSPNAFPARFSDGKFAGPAEGSGYNPYNLLMQSGYSEEYKNSAQSLIALDQDLSELITPGLKANLKFSWDAFNMNVITRKKAVEQWLASGRDDEGNLIYNQTNQGTETLSFATGSYGERTIYLEGSLIYNRLFNDVHRVGGLFLYNQKERNVLTASSSEGALPYKNQGIAGRMTYAFKDRYFVEGNFGYNGSENFSPGKQFGFFPSGAIGWMVSSEPFFEGITGVVDVFKLRGSYGIVGNDKIGGSRRFIYNATINRPVTGYTFGVNHNGYSGLRVGEWPNENVGWEESTKLNLGIELSFFRKLKLQGDLFQEDREGIFMQRESLPGFVGVTTKPWVNVGKMENKGFDASMEYSHSLGDLHLTARGNFTYTRNKLIDTDQPDYEDLYRNREGKPYGQQFGLVSMGLFESEAVIASHPEQQFGPVRPGDIKYRDINGDGVVDIKDEVAIGRTTIPEIVYGFGATAAWKGLDLSVFFQGIGNTTFTMGGGAIYGFSSGNVTQSNMYEDLYLNRWSVENPNPNAVYPRLSSSYNTNNTRTSTFFQRNGSFIRLKNAELGYNLPKNIAKKIHMNNVRFYASGVNLLTFSSFKLWDPEMGGGQGEGYPPSRIINFGVNVNF